VGLCSAAPLEHPHALLNLANHTAVAGLFEKMHLRFRTLYARRAMVHHYAGGKRAHSFSLPATSPNPR
jgi:tubulin epsilon